MLTSKVLWSWHVAKQLMSKQGERTQPYQPRVPRIPRFVNFRELPANVCLRDGPLILGLHETVIPIPRDLSPGFGVAREIFLMFPELKEAIICEPWEEESRRCGGLQDQDWLPLSTLVHAHVQRKHLSATMFRALQSSDEENPAGRAQEGD